MKRMRKILAMLLVMTMVMGFSITAAADETYTITIENAASEHTYEAYQIFKGSYDEQTDKLSNIVWGTGVTPEGQTVFGDAEAKAASLTDETAAKKFAVDLIPYLDGKAITFSSYDEENGVYTISNLEPGYYLIKDQDDSLTGDDTSYTTYILELVSNETIEPKSEVPTSHKKVDDANDSLSVENETNWQDSADYDIGDEVPFQLSGTLPGNYGEYTTYKMIFHDTLSEGLTLNEDSIKVYVSSLENKTEVKSGFVIRTADECTDGCSFEVELTDLRNLYDGDGNHIATTKNSTISVEYTAVLNENAKIGKEGNPNTMYMEFSNNPNKEGDGELGKTEEDLVIVFTYKVIINKVDDSAEKKALAGAEFTLKKVLESGEMAAVGVYKVNDEGTSFEFEGLDDGIYYLEETVTPEGYNTIEPIRFEIVAQHDVHSDNPQLTLLNSNQIDEDGKTVTENIIFLATVDLADGTITSNIVNKSGLVLPETGGIGTTIFYVAGVVLVLGAAVVMVTRKRMEQE